MPTLHDGKTFFVHVICGSLDLKLNLTTPTLLLNFSQFVIPNVAFQSKKIFFLLSYLKLHNSHHNIIYIFFK